jgi:ubiquinone/menaquinone biosynthesis C-methylase UbiE
VTLSTSNVHRYALAINFCSGRSVLDIASGEGYGAALLAQEARFVVGVDIDPQVIQHAKNKYLGANLSFCVGSCAAIPFSDNSIDVVSSFETIEHHDAHDEMLKEIKRVLKPGGILILSSPNRLIYSDEPAFDNPYHVKELYYSEFHELLVRYFRHQYLYGQRLAAGSFVFPLEDRGATHYQAYSGNVLRINRKTCDLPSPTYFVAICSDKELPDQSMMNSVYLDSEDDLLRNGSV